MNPAALCASASLRAASCENPDNAATPAGIDALIARRTEIWKRLAAKPTVAGPVDLTELTKLIQANEAVETALAAKEIAAELTASEAKVERMRCIVCRGFIRSCETEHRHILQRGNSAVLSAAKLYLAANQ